MFKSFEWSYHTDRHQYYNDFSTRNDLYARNFGIELSTPGLKGQSGGPLFDENGIIYGMQYQTIFEYLGFDVVDKTELINNRKKKISNYPYIHLGRCIHVDVIKDFLREHNVKFNEQ